MRRLLVHHHAVAYVDPGGSIWLPSFIARWVEALAPHFQEIILLMHQTPEQSRRQDECVRAGNVRLASLGPPGRFWDRFSRRRRIVAACRAASRQADALIVRGITPRQYVVWKNVAVPHRAFLLVGSIAAPPPFGLRSYKQLYAFLMFFHRRNEIRKMARTGLMLANSPQLVRELEAVTSASATFVPTNSIRQSEFPSVHVRPVARPARLLFCSRVIEGKGIFELLTAVHVLNREGVACTLDVVGPVDADVRAQVELQADRLGLGEKVFLHGLVAFGPELFRFYQEADVFVLPTFYNEGFPHVLWEAAANACPVVTTDIAPIAGLWTNGQHAVMIPPKDAAALTRALRTVLEDEDLRQHLIRSSYAYAGAFHVEACAERTVDVFNEHWT